MKLELLNNKFNYCLINPSTASYVNLKNLASLI